MFHLIHNPLDMNRSSFHQYYYKNENILHCLCHIHWYLGKRKWQLSCYKKNYYGKVLIMTILEWLLINYGIAEIFLCLAEPSLWLVCVTRPNLLRNAYCTIVFVKIFGYFNNNNNNQLPVSPGIWCSVSIVG